MRTKVLRSLAMAAARAGATKVDLLDSDDPPPMRTIPHE
jgi:hypothetical protein